MELGVVFGLGEGEFGLEVFLLGKVFLLQGVQFAGQVVELLGFGL